LHRHILGLTDSGHYYEKAGNKKTALHFHRQALEASQKAQLPEHEARSLANIGRLLRNDSTEESLQYLFSALTIAQRIRHHALQADIYGSITAVYKQQEKYKEALAALELHKNLDDTLLAINQRKELEHLKAAESRKLERAIGVTVTFAVLLLAAFLAFYFRRTRLLNRQLQQSVQVRDKLFSILAHDLRGPAINLVQVLTLIEEAGLSEEEEKLMLAMLKKQSQSLSDTLNGLLHWSKAQLDGVQPKPQDFNPVPLIDKNIALLEGQMQQKNIRLSLQVTDDIFVHADPDHFDLVIRNLLSNAIKFSHQGGAIEISAVVEKRELIFAVKDQGVGITPENQQKFTRLHMDSTFGTAGEKGTGLGLPLVKDFVRANKGRIWMESEKDKGTTFYFTFQPA
jgi:signal transduction histidine kinase